ncbi:MAG: tetratricopeptide repeat protein, partial [Candidatus Melainabacteria bacterium]|nr:tetratricopeptide repeat protein [Candidatus Melainabacteria bacterium]
MAQFKQIPVKIDTAYTLTTTTLAASLGLSICCATAAATKLVAQPLPRERHDKDFSQAQTFITPPSYFQRRPDYRDEERQKKQAEDEARQANEQAKQKAQLEHIENLKKRQELAVEANNQAVALGKQGRWAEAIEAHETAVRYDSQNKQFRINLSAARTQLGQNELATGDADAAASSFRKALATAPDNGLAGRLLCEAMKRQGHNPASADVRLKIGDQLAATGNYEGALVEFQAALQLESSQRTYVKMGDLAVHFGQISTATNWYRQAIVKDPNCGAAHRQLGLVALMQKDHTTAATSLRKAVILDSKDNAAGQALVDIWRHQV